MQKWNCTTCKFLGEPFIGDWTGTKYAGSCSNKKSHYYGDPVTSSEAKKQYCGDHAKKALAG